MMDVDRKMSDNVTLARQFNGEVQRLIEYFIDKLGESKERKTLLTKLKVATATKPFLVFDLWCEHVIPYHNHILNKNEAAWNYPETLNNEMFLTLGLGSQWQSLESCDKSRVWEMLERVNKICIAIYKKRRQYGAMDAVSAVMENLISK